MSSRISSARQEVSQSAEDSIFAYRTRSLGEMIKIDYFSDIAWFFTEKSLTI